MMEEPSWQEREQQQTVEVCFTTKLNADHFKVPEVPVRLSVKESCSGLSAIINHLLSLEQKVSFDFLIGNEYLRSNLEEHLRERHLSLEHTLEIEYTLALDKPVHESVIGHNDWVCSVDANVKNFYITGSCDSIARFWSSDGECLTSCIAHTGSVKDISLILQDSNRVWFVSASQDQTLRLWKVNTREKNSVSCERLLKGHTKSVECVVSREGSLDSLHKEFVWLSSGSWDKSIRLWKLPFVDMHNTSAESSVPTNRKRKKKVASKKSDCQVLEPSVTLEDAHSHCVTCIAWPMEDIILSGSWDLSIKQWSVEKKTAISTVRASDVIQCMSYNNSLHLLATGHSDRCIRIWDFRLAENSGANNLRMESIKLSLLLLLLLLLLLIFKCYSEFCSGPTFSSWMDIFSGVASQ